MRNKGKAQSHTLVCLSSPVCLRSKRKARLGFRKGLQAEGKGRRGSAPVGNDCRSRAHLPGTRRGQRPGGGQGPVLRGRPAAAPGARALLVPRCVRAGAGGAEPPHRPSGFPQAREALLPPLSPPSAARRELRSLRSRLFQGKATQAHPAGLPCLG